MKDLKSFAHFQPDVKEIETKSGEHDTFVLTAPSEQRELVWTALGKFSDLNIFRKDGLNRTQIELDTNPGHNPRVTYTILAVAIYLAEIQMDENIGSDLIYLWSTCIDTHKDNINVAFTHSKIKDLNTDEISEVLEYMIVRLVKIAIDRWKSRINDHGFNLGVINGWITEANDARFRLQFMQKELMLDPDTYQEGLCVCNKNLGVLDTFYEKIKGLKAKIVALQEDSENIRENFLTELEIYGTTATLYQQWLNVEKTMSEILMLVKDFQSDYDEQEALNARAAIRRVTPPAPKK
jgi:hypothetical protein